MRYLLILFILVISSCDICHVELPATITKIERNPLPSSTEVGKNYIVHVNNKDEIAFYTDSLYKVGDIIK